jgi:hypothetical protein
MFLIECGTGQLELQLQFLCYQMWREANLTSDLYKTPTSPVIKETKFTINIICYCAATRDNQKV